MRREDHTLDVPATPGPGKVQRCDTYVDKWVEVAGTFTGSCDVEGRFKPAGAFYTVASVAGAGAPTLVEVRPLFYEVRLNTTAATGAPTGHLAGLNRRTE